ncbi:glycerate kinase [Escherichia albertii]|uniref:glycerate kinase n=1 Tax=Escherichia albertii TaxID=208962 RepID=UPI00235E7FD8|nr:glycerate kinase [Escherichia albertii]WDB79583.1 glycerate kinase [Escherichia albertii]
MKIVISPDSFKECLPAWKVAEALATGWRKVLPGSQLVCLPVADGGEGTLETLIHATHGTFYTKTVTGPLGESRHAQYGILGNQTTAVIEIAQASGLELLSPVQRSPLYTTSFGTGELILAALEHNIDTVILCLGGSATNDGGIGLMSALGALFTDADGNSVSVNGMGLSAIHQIDLQHLDPRLKNVKFIAACDVTNPLTGENGATRVFGQQKGASADDLEQLEQGMQNYADCIRRCCGKDINAIPGTGAAGDVGAALMAFLDARLQPGISLVLEAIQYTQHLKYAALAIVGEGKLDSQSLNGKAPVGAAKIAHMMGVPVVAIAGYIDNQLDLNELRQCGIDACFSVINGPCDLPTALSQGEDNLIRLGENLAGYFRAVLS